MRTIATSKSPEYSVSGLVVHTRPDSTASVSDNLNAMQGVEVHAMNEGKLVVTVEELPGEKSMIQSITDINNTAGVINAALVYSETLQDAEEEA